MYPHPQLNMYAAAEFGRSWYKSDWFVTNRLVNSVFFSCRQRLADTITRHIRHIMRTHAAKHSAPKAITNVHTTNKYPMSVYHCSNTPNISRHKPWRSFCCDVRGVTLCHDELADELGKQLSQSPWFKRRVRP